MRALTLAVWLLPAAVHAQPAELEVGGRAGLRLNLGGLGTGGLQLGGSFLYRVSEAAWFDTQAALSIGGGGRHCYLARDREATCDPSVASGASLMVLAGPRWFFDELHGVTPHAGGGIGLGYTSFPADDLNGAAFPLWVSGGARAPLREGLSLGGEVMVTAGPAHLGRDQGWKPFVSVALVGSMDFSL